MVSIYFSLSRSFLRWSWCFVQMRTLTELCLFAEAVKESVELMQGTGILLPCGQHVAISSPQVCYHLLSWYFYHMQILCSDLLSTVHAWLFIWFFLCSQWRYSTTASASRTMLKYWYNYFQFQKQLCQIKPSQLLISVNVWLVFRLWKNSWTVTFLQISLYCMDPRCASATTLHVFNWSWRSVAPSTVLSFPRQVRS